MDRSNRWLRIQNSISDLVVLDIDGFIPFMGFKRLVLAFSHFFKVVIPGVTILHFHSRTRRVLDGEYVINQSLVGPQLFVFQHMRFLSGGGSGNGCPPTLYGRLDLPNVLIVLGFVLKVGEFFGFLYAHGLPLEIGKIRKLYFYNYSEMDNYISCPISLKI